MAWISNELIKRLCLAHSACVKSAQRYEAATPGTQTKRLLDARWLRAEANFDRAVMAVREAGAKNARNK